MKRGILTIFVILAATAFGAGTGKAVLKATDGEPISGHVRATILVYDSETAVNFVWAGTTDGSLPALRVVDGEITNLDRVIPGYVRDMGDIWLDIRIDGESVLDRRIRYGSGDGLRREIPVETGEITEELEDELQIGLPGDELYVASATTGFGVDTPVERVDIDGAVGIKAGTSPAPTTDFGKVYVDDGDGHLYFMEDDGTTTDLLETSSVTAGGGILAAFGTEQIHACVGETRYLGVHLSASSTPYTHAWTGDTSPLSATNIPNPVFNTSSAGTYNLTYTITDGEGGSSQYMFTVTVHDNPSPTIGSWPASGECEGQPILLSTNECYLRYCWDQYGPCEKVFEATETGTYTVTVTDKWGCEGTASHSVSFLAPPAADAGASVSVCEGGSDPTIGGSPSASGGTPPYFYEWSGIGIGYLSSVSTPNPTFDVSAAPVGSYSFSLRVIDGNGCEDEAGPVIVTINTPPVASASSNSPVCPGDDLELYGSASAGTSPYSYSWTGPGGFTSSAQNPVISGVDSGDEGTYTVTVTDGSGCTSTGATTTTLLDPPSITSHPADVTTGTGSSATFSVTATGTGTLTYQWQQNTGSSWADISGATASTYVIASVTGSMDGWQFRCIVSGDCAPPDTSAAATLTLSSSLYTFTSHTFTTCGTTDRYGPTLSQCRSSYSTTWDENDAFFYMTTQGFQRWTVPETGTYRITAAGGEGGPDAAGIGGDGAVVRADFTLSAGEVIQIVVASRGESHNGNSTGGGGGSFVVKNDGTPLLIAGGGAGSINGIVAGNNGVFTENSSQGRNYGIGLGGRVYQQDVLSDSEGGGAGGLSGNGEGRDDSYGRSFTNGAIGGWGWDYVTGGGGGFGGFGGGGSYHNSGSNVGGGGGGYTGGSGNWGYDTHAPGGGGSYVHSSGSSRYNVGLNTGNGYVTIQKL